MNHADADLHAVFRTLRDTDARLERFAWLGDGLAVALWQRETALAETLYQQPGHHTLSYYLDGGHGTERSELPGVFGAPSRLCALPDDHESRWWIRGRLRFLHLYFLPQHFTRRAVLELDREPRELTLADRTYFEDPAMAGLCQVLATSGWSDADGRLQANETAHLLLTRLLQAQSQRRPQLRLKGGLAPAIRRRLRDYIVAHLDQPLTLGQLADVACLSEFHLARMFRTSFGAPPSSWIAALRLDRARELLRTGDQPLEQIAAQCGYADSSHLGHRFRDAVGVAPTAYRRALRGRPLAAPGTLLAR